MLDVQRSSEGQWFSYSGEQGSGWRCNLPDNKPEHKCPLRETLGFRPRGARARNIQNHMNKEALLVKRCSDEREPPQVAEMQMKCLEYTRRID